MLKHTIYENKMAKNRWAYKAMFSNDISMRRSKSFFMKKQIITKKMYCINNDNVFAKERYAQIAHTVSDSSATISFDLLKPQGPKFKFTR